jgi:DNA modification methylase
VLINIFNREQAKAIFEPNFENSEISNNFRGVGTSRDNATEPVYRWFRYPAKFSNKLVDTAITYFNIKPGQLILDPFAGTGTSLIGAKLRGVDSVGIEAHFFLQWVGVTKLYWDFDLEDLQKKVRNVGENIRDITKVKSELEIVRLPELVTNCFSTNSLEKLVAIREYLKKNLEEPFLSFFNLALTDTLRLVANVSMGWPYVSPKKKLERETDVEDTFIKRIKIMYEDLLTVSKYSPLGKSYMVLGDARNLANNWPSEMDLESGIDNSVDLVISSPPYLNNYDYADRTRLETYFFGYVSSWREITDKVRDKLIVSATTQVKRDSPSPREILSRNLKEAMPNVYCQLLATVDSISKIRINRAGKKKYDYMVAGYFNDMFHVLKEILRVLKPGCSCIFVLGDSAPYGIYIPTDKLLGEIAVGVGFKEYRMIMLRERGKKWKNLVQRHNLPLRESVVILRKAE